IPVPSRYPERAGAHHEERDAGGADAEQIRLDFGELRPDDLALEYQRQHEIGRGHEGECRARDHRAVEMAGYIDRVVHQDVELLGAEHDAGNATDKAEEDL